MDFGVMLLEEIRSLRFPAPLPSHLLAVEQRFDASKVADVVEATRSALLQSGVLTLIKPGASMAVGVGSRGIANLPAIVRTVVQGLRAAGAKPFIVPAMGSHGGATAEGQVALLADLGVTPNTVGTQIHATLDVKEIARIQDGPPLYQDVISAGADHTFLIARVKPHTDFHGPLESGLTKMCVIGLGKRQGAEAMHACGGVGFQRFLVPAARLYEARTNLIGGLATIENAYDETAEIAGFRASEIGGPREMQLLERARSLMASLPFPKIDVLVVREIGKNISGTGMDTNIINRLLIPRQPENPQVVDIAVIVVLDLTKETHGNAAGIGLANVTTVRAVGKTDWQATYTNAITSGIFGMYRTAIPIAMPDDERALQVASRGCGEPAQYARWVFVENTLKLGLLWVSESLRSTVEAHPQLKIVREGPLTFDSEGSMISPWQMV